MIRPAFGGVASSHARELAARFARHVKWSKNYLFSYKDKNRV